MGQFFLFKLALVFVFFIFGSNFFANDANGKEQDSIKDLAQNDTNSDLMEEYKRYLEKYKKNTVTIIPHRLKPTIITNPNVLTLNSKNPGEFVEIVVRGDVNNFKLLYLMDSNGNFNDKGEVYHEIRSVKDKIIIILAALPEGMPSDKISWTTSSGKVHEWIISEGDMVDHGNLKKEFPIK